MIWCIENIAVRLFIWKKIETVSIYSYTGYEDVYILPAEAKEAEKLGAISRDVKVSYKVPYSGSIIFLMEK